MDYSSDLQDCLPKISIETLEKKNIDYIRDNFEKDKDVWTKQIFYTDNFLDNLMQSRNHLYQFNSVEFNEDILNEKDEFVIELERIKA